MNAQCHIAESTVLLLICVLIVYICPEKGVERYAIIVSLCFQCLNHVRFCIFGHTLNFCANYNSVVFVLTCFQLPLCYSFFSYGKGSPMTDFEMCMEDCERR